MAFSYLNDLTWLSIILLIGLFGSILALKTSLPRILILIITGIALGKFNLVDFSPSFITSFGIFALVMIVFDSTSKFKVKDLARFSPYALKLAVVFLGLNLVFLTLFTHVLFHPVAKMTTFLISFMFAALMSGTDAGSVMSIIEEKKYSHTILKLLEFESIINTPITVIVPLIILYWFQGTLQAGDIFIVFVRGVMAGIGTGLVLGLVSFRFMRNKYMDKLSPLVVIALALISYTLAENIGGNGVLSVTTLGVVFGWAVIKHKENLKNFVSIFTTFLTIVIFILLGLFIKIPATLEFLIRSMVLFTLYTILRFVASEIAFFRSGIKLREKIFIALNNSKGVAVASIAFILIAALQNNSMLTQADMSALSNVLNLTFLFILYSIIVSTITLRFNRFFLLESRRYISMDTMKQRAKEEKKK